jgi:hypothetical protein
MPARVTLCVLLAALAFLTACTSSREALSDTVDAENRRFVYGHIAAAWEHCCALSPDEQAACFLGATSRVDASLAQLMAIHMAGSYQLEDILCEGSAALRDIWSPAIIQAEDGRTLNQMTALGQRDWIQLDARLPRRDAPGSDPRVATFTLPRGTHFTMRYRDTHRGIRLSGQITLVQTAELPGAEHGTAPIAHLAHFSLSAARRGHVITLSLDEAAPHNALRIDADGRGTLHAALTVASPSPALAGLVQVGSTIYIELPVTVAPDLSWLHLHIDPATPGSALTPTVPIILLGADTPPAPITPPPASHCAGDTNGNGIPDGAESLIYSHQHLRPTPAHH